MREEAAPTVQAGEGQNLDSYADDLLKRFANPALKHRLAQIAMDGSQKIPQRWLSVLQQGPTRTRGLLTGIAAWLNHIEQGDDLNDPLADDLRKAVVGNSTRMAMAALFGGEGILRSSWRPTDEDIGLIVSVREKLDTN